MCTSTPLHFPVFLSSSISHSSDIHNLSISSQVTHVLSLFLLPHEVALHEDVLQGVNSYLEHYRGARGPQEGGETITAIDLSEELGGDLLSFTETIVAAYTETSFGNRTAGKVSPSHSLNAEHCIYFHLFFPRSTKFPRFAFSHRLSVFNSFSRGVSQVKFYKKLGNPCPCCGPSYAFLAM